MSDIRIGIVGDLHTHWDEVDVIQFGGHDYDLLFFTGDLGGGTRESSLRIARGLSRLRHPTLVMPGNNDTGGIAELAAELAHRGGIQRLAAMRRGRDAGPAVRLCGYSNHRIERNGTAVTLLAARPHSMGGPELSFAEHMAANFGVRDMAESARRLCELVDQADTEQLVFLAHNGPVGLGDEPHDMWGCDFRPGGGDWGDPDLAEAIAYARRRGRQVLAVVAGHMHLRTRCGNERPWWRREQGTLYVNAARVPRIIAADDDVYRHHLALHIGADGAEVEERLVPQSGWQPGPAGG